MIDTVSSEENKKGKKQAGRKRGRPKKKKVISQKRFVKAVKVFMTPEEEQHLLTKVGDFKSLSNYIRYHLGMGLNETGRKRRFTKPVFDLDLLTEIE